MATISLSSSQPTSPAATWADLQKKTEVFHSVLNEVFAGEGIDAQVPVELSLGVDGQVLVANNHPDKEKIAALFRRDPGLRDLFANIEGGIRFFTEVQEHMDFQKLYARDPETALRKYSHLFESDYRVRYKLTRQKGELAANWAFEIQM